MKEILEHLYQYKSFSKDEAKVILTDIASGKYNHYQIASFLTAFIMRSISLEELKGFREALLELSAGIDLSPYEAIDLCGSGGDGKNTFNISTLASFVTAGAGIPVAKHGNYGVSSVSGSSNVLEHLGVKFQTEEKKLKQQMDEANICFMHAPFFHPALKEVAPVRKQLGVKTFFNMLGPLVNPANPKKQLTGVFNLELGRIYNYLFQDTDTDYSIVYALDGFDEISLTGNSKIFSRDKEIVVSPDYFGFEKVNYEDIHGGSTKEQSAEIFDKIIKGKGNQSQNNVVIANAAIAIKTYNNKLDIGNCLEMAKDSLYGLKALNSFNTLKNLS